MIIFLDFDGVLHDCEVFLEGGEAVLKSYPGKSLFEYVPFLEQALAPCPDVRIVLSTSWVKQLGFDVAKARLPENLQQRIIGSTWHDDCGFDTASWMFLSRYEQINAYVKNNDLGNDWLAVDDDGDEWPEAMRPNLIHCHDDFLGLSDKRTYARLVDALASQP